MEKEVFRNQIERLKKTFGPTFYPDERLFLFWRELQIFPDQLFVEAVDALISDSRFPPLLQELLGAMRRRRKYTFEEVE